MKIIYKLEPALGIERNQDLRLGGHGRTDALATEIGARARPPLRTLHSQLARSKCTRLQRHMD